MKIRGQQVKGPNRELLVIPRGDDQADIVLYAQAVLDTALFDKLCPEPVPPSRIIKGGQREFQFDDPGYKAACVSRTEKYMAFMILQSLNLSENELEWETVKLNDHRTWLNYENELKEAGFSAMEVKRIENLAIKANCLSESHLEAARANFLRTQEELAKASSGLHTVLQSTPSGTPASDGESSLPISIAPADSAGTS